MLLQTVRFKNELVRNITIKLGYANAKVSIYVPADKMKVPLNINVISLADIQM